MRFLADESCDFRVVRALREAGHHVTTIIEIAPGADDAAVIQMAVHEAEDLRDRRPGFRATCLCSGEADAGCHSDALSIGRACHTAGDDS